MPIGLQALEETCSTWSNPRRVSFQFNQEPSWLPIYRHLAFPRFVSLCQIAHESKTSSWLKDIDIIHKIFGVGHAFFLLFHPRNSKLKKNRSQIGPQQLHGSANSSIELLSFPSTHQQSETNWMNVCPILTSATISSKTEPPPKKIFPIPRKPQILKKKF